MTREEKCKLAIERGYTYDTETGLIYNRFKKPILTKNEKGYIKFQLKINTKKYNMRGHQFAWYWVNKECVECLDHINNIRNDNRICNLRSVTKQQNQFNLSKAKGYSWHKVSNKWNSRIMINQKNIHLGVFNTEQEARNAYLAAKEIYHKI